jgi:hypothetical protein
VALREDPAAGIRQRDRERAAVLESQNERRAHQGGGVFVRRQIDGAFDPVQARDRQPVAGRERLISGDPVRDATKHLTAAAEVAHAHAFFNEFHL